MSTPSLEPQYPPPEGDTGATTIPRQLNRWIDINPQGGALGRAHKYITLPAFTSADSWNGYSDIVTTFNFSCENNLSLRQFTAPTNPNFALCVSYRVGGVVTRYLLWDATGSNFSFYIETYTGQRLSKNFRLEVWNTSQGAASNADIFYFWTTVLAKKDYRWEEDSVLDGIGPQVTEFHNTTNAATGIADGVAVFIPEDVVTGGGGAVTQWKSTDLFTQFVISGTGTCIKQTVPFDWVKGSGGNDITTTFDITALGINMFVNIQFFLSASSPLFSIALNGTTILTMNRDDLSHVSFDNPTGTLPTDQLHAGGTGTYMVGIMYNTNGIRVVIVSLDDGAMQILEGEVTTPVDLSAGVDLTFGTGNYGVMEIVGQDSAGDDFWQQLAIMTAFGLNKYAGLDTPAMPLAFPTNSVSVTN